MLLCLLMSVYMYVCVCVCVCAYVCAPSGVAKPLSIRPCESGSLLLCIVRVTSRDVCFHATWACIWSLTPLPN